MLVKPSLIKCYFSPLIFTSNDFNKIGEEFGQQRGLSHEKKIKLMGAIKMIIIIIFLESEISQLSCTIELSRKFSFFRKKPHAINTLKKATFWRGMNCGQ